MGVSRPQESKVEMGSVSWEVTCFAIFGDSDKKIIIGMPHVLATLKVSVPPYPGCPLW